MLTQYVDVWIPVLDFQGRERKIEIDIFRGGCSNTACWRRRSFAVVF